MELSRPWGVKPPTDMKNYRTLSREQVGGNRKQYKKDYGNSRAVKMFDRHIRVVTVAVKVTVMAPRKRGAQRSKEVVQIASLKQSHTVGISNKIGSKMV